MIRRVIAAVVALVLAVAGALLVMSYANAADERALEGMETIDVLVATTDIAEGTSAEELAALTETEAVPQQFVLDDAVEDLDDVTGTVLTTDVSVGEQLLGERFATEEELRTRDAFELPEEAADLHQVTVPLDTPRALGGDIAAGDTVGVFVSLTSEADQEAPTEEDPAEDGGDSATATPLVPGVVGDQTHLTLDKVLVTRVQGGYVEAPPALPDEETDEAPEETPQEPADVILVTMALPAPDAEKLVFAMEFGNVWLSYEPEGADNEDTDIVIIAPQDEVRDLWDRNLSRFLP